MHTTNPFDEDKLREECGVFGIFGHNSAAPLTTLGLHALQHRGQESAGIVVCEGDKFHLHHAAGLVGDTFSKQRIMDGLKGSSAIGHTRYATTGGNEARNYQPLYADFDFGGFAIAHNGNLTNGYTLRRQLVRRGCIFHSTSDTEAIVHLMAMARGGAVIDRLVEALRQVDGAYSLVTINRNQIIGVRDPMGVRPLVLGRLGSSHVLCSETCALDIIGADFVRDVEPGEMVVLSAEGVTSLHPFQPAPHRLCIFEYIYFARPDSIMDGVSVYEMRKRIGMELAHEKPVAADVVVPIPDSGVPAALGYASASGIPYELGIIRNHYVGRTFIEPTEYIRHLGVRLKHSANRRFLDQKRVILVDDSIVRGTTSMKIVEMIRRAGAIEVHVRISSPPTRHGCFYGINTPETAKLLAHDMSTDQIREHIGADSLAFISIDGLYSAAGKGRRDPAYPGYCDACFTGDYPIPLTDLKEASEQVNMSNLTSEVL